MTDLKAKHIISMAVLFVAFLSVTCGGAFAISAERHEKAEISRRIMFHEGNIKKLRRDNEELSVKIAEQENPATLTRRASTYLTPPKMAGIVWAYENYDGGRVDYTDRSKGLVSFRTPEEREGGARQ